LPRRLDVDGLGFRKRQAARGLALQALRLLGFGVELVDDVLGKARRLRLPCLGQEIDEQAVAGRHGVDHDAAREGNSQGLAVGIAPRSGDIGADGVLQTIDGQAHGLREGDDDDAVGDAGADIRHAVELQDDAGISVPVSRLYLGGRSGLGLGHRRPGREGAEALSQGHDDAESGHPERGRAAARGCPRLPGRPQLALTDHDGSFTLGCVDHKDRTSMCP
jgi:hypothetical protein